jgi:hypothetical protein
LNLSVSERNRLQNIAEDMQKSWQQKSLQPGATAGVLGSFDKNLLVSPPNGYEIGYVPIITKQERTPQAQEYQSTAYASAKSIWESKEKQAKLEAKAASAKKTTITCTKGKLAKKVTAVKPKCPQGYKKK